MSKNDYSIEAEKITVLLLSADITKVRQGIEQCHHAHTAAIILPLLTLLKDSGMREFHADVRTLLNSIKADGAIDFLMKAFRNPEFHAVQADIICALWSGPIATGKAFNEIINTALEGDYRMQMEAITLIEENSSDITEEQILETFEAVTRKLNQSSDINPILVDMHRAISKLRANAEAE